MKIDQSDTLGVPEPAAPAAKNTWKGLGMEEVFKPHAMIWNDREFTIERPPECFLAYDLENYSLEEYFSELRENWDENIRNIPLDEVNNLRLLRLVGAEITIDVYVMLKESVPAYPDRLVSSGTDVGGHPGGVITVDGCDYPVSHVIVETTPGSVQKEIKAAQMARSPGVVPRAPSKSDQVALSSYGKLMVTGNFEHALYEKKAYALSEARKARAVIRHLCLNAVGKPNKVSKTDLMQVVDTVAADWRPSSHFKGHLQGLYEAVGRDGGYYWIKD